MEIIRERYTETTVTYSLDYDIEEELGCGWTFPCDAQGNVKELHPIGQAHLEACREGHCQGPNVIFRGVIKREQNYRHPAIGRCECGKEVELSDPLDNFCLCCGRCYNMCGNLVRPSTDPDLDEPWDENGAP